MPCNTPLSPHSAPHRSPQWILWLAGAVAWSAAAAAQPGPPQVPVAPAQVRVVGTGFETDGTVQPVKQSTVAAQTQGRIGQWLVKAGDPVKAGQLLAVLDDRDSQAGLERAGAGVAQAQAQLRNAEAQWQRTRDLKNQGFVAQAALDSAEAAYKGAQASALQARASQTQSAVAQGHTRVTAPYSGFVLETHADAGDLATPGKPLLTLYAPEPLRVVIHVPASRSSTLGASAAEILVPDGRRLRPTQTTRLATADPVSQTVEWRLNLPPLGTAGLLPGQQVRVRLGAGGEARLLVPSSAILRRGELTAVYVARTSGDTPGFVLRAVRTGQDRGGDGTEVLAGLKAGEAVALDPVRAGLAHAQPKAP